MLLIEEETLRIKKAKSVMADTSPWQHGVLVLNCHRNSLNMISEIRLIFS